MKKSIIILVLIVSSCSKPSTAPNASNGVSSHPFPQTFQHIKVSFRNLPEQWSTSEREWNYTVSPPIDTTIASSGSNNNFSGDWDFDYTNNSFSRSGDTLIAASPYLRLVVDTIAGRIELLQIDNYEGDSKAYSGENLDCRNCAYGKDSSQTVIRLQGEAIQNDLVLLKTFSGGYNGQEMGGQSGSSETSFAGTPDSSSVLTITFIQ